MSPSSLTFYPTHRNTEQFFNKFYGEKDVEAVLQRLDRLTQEEARMTVPQTLEIVYGLFQNMRVVMDGEQALPSPFLSLLNIHTPGTRWQGIDRQYPGCSWYFFFGDSKLAP